MDAVDHQDREINLIGNRKDIQETAYKGGSAVLRTIGNSIRVISLLRAQDISA